MVYRESGGWKRCRPHGPGGGGRLGSRLMHLLTASHVAEELGLSDRGRMLVGAIAPDGHNGHRDRTHFKGPRYDWSDSAPYQYGRFLVKYRQYRTDSFFIGYLTHLVADDEWQSALCFSGILEQLRARGAGRETLHHDFYLSNAKLLAKRDGGALRRRLASGSWSDAMDEVEPAGIKQVKQDALNDFDYPVANLKAPLAVLPLELLEASIERAAVRAIDAAYPWIHMD